MPPGSGGAQPGGIAAYDVSQLARIGAVPISSITAVSMLRFGADGLAYSDGATVHFVRATFVR